MAAINVTNVRVLNNPAPFSSPFQFEITFECYPPGLQEELEWKLIYVGSADDASCDQELDSVLVGPVNIGKNKFVFTAPPPDAAAIPDKDLMEVTVILLTALYREKEFIRIGYYVNNEYPEEEKQLKLDWDDYRAKLEDKYRKEQQVAQQKQDVLDYRASHTPAAAVDSPAGSSSSSSPSSRPVTPPPSFEPIIIPPTPPLPAIRPAALQRNILDNCPRVTRFQIAWDDEIKAGRMDNFAMDEGDEAKAKEEEERVTREVVERTDDGERGTKRRRLEGEEKGGEAGGGKEEKVVVEDEDDEDEEDEDEDEDVIEVLSSSDEAAADKNGTTTTGTAAAEAPSASSAAAVH